MSVATATRSGPPSAWARLGWSEPLDVVALLLALLVIPKGGGWSTFAGVAGAAVVSASPGLRRHPAVWLAIGGVRLGGQLVDWHGIDDHEVLISYACLALGLARCGSDPERLARRSLLALVGLTMAFATTWKVGSGQFLDGDTMRYTLLTDPRFDLATSWLAGMSDAAIAANDLAVSALRDPTSAASVTLVEPARLTVLAYLLTAGAVLVEGTLAVLFLLPRSTGRQRAWGLAVFGVATYLIVPVSRFGLILVTCAYAGSEGRRDRAVLLSTAAFCVVWPPVWATLGGSQ